MNRIAENNKYSVLIEIDSNIESSLTFSKEEIEILEKYSNDEDENIRSEVARILVNFTEERGENILKKLATDKKSIVRAEACDSLNQSKSISTYQILKNIAKLDKNGIVRGYAINSLGKMAKEIDIIDDTKEFLVECLEVEKVVFTKINIYKALYNFGEQKYLFLLIAKLKTSRYQNRCATINSLEEIMNDTNYNIIRMKLLELEQVESVYAVTTSIGRVLRTSAILCSKE